MVQSAVTNFREQEGQNISHGFIFAGAPKNYVTRVLNFAESPKMRRIAKFYKKTLNKKNPEKTEQ